MSSVKYNLKISNCNILTYINIGAEWESNWRRGQNPSLLLEQKSFIMLNVRMVHRYSLFILHTTVVLIPPHFPVLGLFLVSQPPVVFSSQCGARSQVARSSSRSPSSTAVMAFSPEKGFSDLRPKSEMNFFF